MALNNQAKREVHLRDYLQVIMKKRWMIVTLLVVLVTTVAIGSYRMKPVYRATTQLLIEKERPAVFAFKEGVGIETSQKDYYQTQYIIIKSRSLAQRVIERLHLDESQEFSGQKEIVNAFLRAIAVEPVRNTRLVNISAESHHPQLAAQMANTLAQLYIQQNLQNRLFIAKGVLDWLPGQSEPSLKSERIESLPSVVNHPLIQDLKVEHAKLKAELANLSKRYKDKHPKMISLKAALRQMEGKIDIETQKIVQSIKTELSGNLEGNNIRVIDLAEVPTKPVRPRTRLNISLALILGLFTGCGLAFFFDYLDNSIKTQEEIEEHIGLPFLGHVPTIKTKSKDKLAKDIFTHTDPKSTVAEAFKSIRTGVVFSSSMESLKSILVTSAGPMEGKTTVAVNLAITLAHGDSRVLLVDSDMRRPCIHKALGLDDSSGLSNYLAAQTDFDSIVQKTEVENLSAVACGPRPPKPAELLGSPKLEEFIAEAKDRFDHIIFDSPPIMIVTDGLVLTKAVDGVIQVIQFGKTSRNILERSKQKLQDIQAKIIGAVLNNVDIEREGYHYPYYYHYYSQKEKGKPRSRSAKERT